MNSITYNAGMTEARVCEGCGGTLGSRYHEVAHAPDVETASIEDLEAATQIYARTIADWVYDRIVANSHSQESTHGNRN